MTQRSYPSDAPVAPGRLVDPNYFAPGRVRNQQDAILWCDRKVAYFLDNYKEHKKIREMLRANPAPADVGNILNLINDPVMDTPGNGGLERQGFSQDFDFGSFPSFSNHTQSRSPFSNSFSNHTQSRSPRHSINNSFSGSVPSPYPEGYHDVRRFNDIVNRIQDIANDEGFKLMPDLNDEIYDLAGVLSRKNLKKKLSMKYLLSLAPDIPRAILERISKFTEFDWYFRI